MAILKIIKAWLACIYIILGMVLVSRNISSFYFVASLYITFFRPLSHPSMCFGITTTRSSPMIPPELKFLLTQVHTLKLWKIINYWSFVSFLDFVVGQTHRQTILKKTANSAGFWKAFAQLIVCSRGIDR